MNTDVKLLVYVHIYGSDNNTKVVVADISGRLIYKDTGGINTKQGRNKDSVKTAAVMITKLNEVLTELSISNVCVLIRNRGAGYSTNITIGSKLILNNLQKYYNVLNSYRTTPLIHGYIRPKKPKKR